MSSFGTARDILNARLGENQAHQSRIVWAAVIANSAAMIAVMSLIGNVERPDDALNFFWWSLLCFGFGTAVSTLAAVIYGRVCDLSIVIAALSSRYEGALHGLHSGSEEAARVSFAMAADLGAKERPAPDLPLAKVRAGLIQQLDRLRTTRDLAVTQRQSATRWFWTLVIVASICLAVGVELPLVKNATGGRIQNAAEGGYSGASTPRPKAESLSTSPGTPTSTSRLPAHRHQTPTPLPLRPELGSTRSAPAVDRKKGDHG
jgi:hypothetical protein